MDTMAAHPNTLQIACAQLRMAQDSLEGPHAGEQYRILQRLIDLLEIDLEPFHRLPPAPTADDPDHAGIVQHTDGTPLDAEERACFCRAVKAFDAAMVKACRLGLTWVPPVANWVVIRRGFGERDLLRRAKCGLEKGVRRPLRHPSESKNLGLDYKAITKAYKALKNERKGDKPRSFREIHLALKTKGLIPNR